MLYLVLFGFVAVFAGGVFAHNAIMAELAKLKADTAQANLHAQIASSSASSAANSAAIAAVATKAFVGTLAPTASKPTASKPAA